MPTWAICYLSTSNSSDNVSQTIIVTQIKSSPCSACTINLPLKISLHWEIIVSLFSKLQGQLICSEEIVGHAVCLKYLLMYNNRSSLRYLCLLPFCRHKYAIVLENTGLASTSKFYMVTNRTDSHFPLAQNPSRISRHIIPLSSCLLYSKLLVTLYNTLAGILEYNTKLLCFILRCY